MESSREDHSSAKTIALCGKGGVGKTALTTLIVHLLRQTNKKILAVDADPAMGLTMALGAGHPKTLGQIREHIIQVARNRDTQQTQQVADMVDYYLLEALAEKDRFSLLAMGRTEILGCYCPVNTLLRSAVETLSASFDLLVLDAEAGLEQINRKVLRKIDHLLVVSDSSARGFQTAGMLQELAQSLTELRPGRIDLIVNRGPVGSETNWEEKASQQGLNLLSIIPEDPLLQKMDQEGKSLLDLSVESPALQAVGTMLKRLKLMGPG